MTTTRIVLYAKDLMIITGKSESAVRRMLAAIRKKYYKDRKALVSVEDFCNFTGLKEGEVMKMLNA
jgi:hypothetical protein